MIWSSLTEAFGKQRRIWEEGEHCRAPEEIDKIIEYIIAYADNAAPARRAVRVFTGVDNGPDGLQLFCGWVETRIASIREIREVLDRAGVKVDTFHLAKTIKDFLRVTWETFDDCSLKPQTSTEEGQEEIIKDYFKKIEISDSAKTYIRYLWSRTRKAPYDIYTDRILCRMGMVKATDPIQDKKARLQTLIENRQPMIRHKKLVILGKKVCLTKEPRCGVCPVSSQCSFAASKALAR